MRELANTHSVISGNGSPDLFQFLGGGDGDRRVYLHQFGRSVFVGELVCRRRIPDDIGRPRSICRHVVPCGDQHSGGAVYHYDSGGMDLPARVGSSATRHQSPLEAVQKKPETGSTNGNRPDFVGKEQFWFRRTRSEAAFVTLLTIANGGDNLSVYIPLFSIHRAFIPLYALIFGVMTALWCLLGYYLTSHRLFGSKLSSTAGSSFLSS